VRHLVLLLSLCAPLSALAADTAPIVRFISCPVYRDADSGKKSGCWLADDRATGLRYDVSQSPYKPDWNRAVLVEGRVASGGANPCGGVVLDPVRTSILPDPCPRHMLPAEGFPGRKFVLPVRNIAPVAIVRPVPAGPYSARTFAVFFEFDRAFVTYQYADFMLDNAVTWLAAAKPRRVVVTGFAATLPDEVSGQSLSERPQIARERAEKVAESLRRMIPGLSIEIRTGLAAEPVDHPDADGLPSQSRRRVEIAAEL
jgi:hypothetical protein